MADTAAALQSMAQAAPGISKINDAYQQGAETALSANNLSEGTTKGFTDVQKGKLMGFCQVLAWRDMPQIWKDIEKTKTDEDLRMVLGG